MFRSMLTFSIILLCSPTFAQEQLATLALQSHEFAGKVSRGANFIPSCFVPVEKTCEEMEGEDSSCANVGCVGGLIQNAVGYWIYTCDVGTVKRVNDDSVWLAFPALPNEPGWTVFEVGQQVDCFDIETCDCESLIVPNPQNCYTSDVSDGPDYNDSTPVGNSDCIGH